MPRRERSDDCRAREQCLGGIAQTSALQEGSASAESCRRLPCQRAVPQWDRSGDTMQGSRASVESFRRLPCKRAAPRRNRFRRLPCKIAEPRRSRTGDCHERVQCLGGIVQATALQREQCLRGIVQTTALQQSGALRESFSRLPCKSAVPRRNRSDGCPAREQCSGGIVLTTAMQKSGASGE